VIFCVDSQKSIATSRERVFKKHKGALPMKKILLRFTTSTAVVLIMGGVCFGQHYNQTNLVSNTSGVAPVTDPQLVNPWAGAPAMPSEIARRAYRR
jgi:hypothetical protein